MRVAAAAAFWRCEDPYSPAPYLMLRGMRWGEIRASSSLDPSVFEAPSSEVRTALKRFLSEGSYAELIEAAEAAMAEPCGRAWLDLQRYVVSACDNMGYSAIPNAIKAELKALVRDFPDLLTSVLVDDTPTANRKTLSWLDEFARGGAAGPGRARAVWSPPPVIEEEPADAADSEAALPDSFNSQWKRCAAAAQKKHSRYWRKKSDGRTAAAENFSVSCNWLRSACLPDTKASPCLCWKSSRTRSTATGWKNGKRRN